VAVKWVLTEPDSAKAASLVVDAAAQGFRLLLLNLAYPEIVNAIWKRYHRRLISLDEARQNLDNLLAFKVSVEPVQPLLKSALEIAARYARAFYDAAFVALVQHLGIRGVTCDEPLYNAVHADFPQIVLLRDW
jgi:predicted nucleic acid-binding protein